MAEYTTYPHVNWTDGMKLNKDAFIAQSNAHTFDLHTLVASTLSPMRYGILPVKDSFHVQMNTDNQNTLRVSILGCQAITMGGAHISINATDTTSHTDANPSVSLALPASVTEVHWVVLIVNPFDHVPFGHINPQENPPRFPYIKSKFAIQLVADYDLNQYAQNPYSLIIGKLLPVGGYLKTDPDYMPPCLSVNASQDLLGLHSELDTFLANLEQSCAQIVQKIYKKSQQNELAELAQFVCDRLMLYLSKAITDFRWLYIYDSPAKMISSIIGLARALKNIIDLRTGSGKEELMNYLSEWSELNQGELEHLLNKMAMLRYNHNDINDNVNTLIQFAKVIGKLFNTLSNLEFIGKKKESGIFVKEGYINDSGESNNNTPKPKRRFFG